jgi:hypothetical protein
MTWTVSSDAVCPCNHYRVGGIILHWKKVGTKHMSLREKAREVKAAGEAERGNFTPHGAPLKAYNYWLRNSKSKHAFGIKYENKRENFCHFWRVVAIWAPLMWLANHAEYFAAGFGVIAIGALLYFFITGPTLDIMAVIGMVIAMIIGFGLLAFGLLSGVSLACKDDEQRSRVDVPPLRYARFGAIVLPTSIPGFVLAKLVFSGYGKQTAITLLTVVALVLLGFIIAAGGGMGLLIILGVALGIGLAILTIVGIGALIAPYIEGRRAQRKEAALERAKNAPVVESTPREPRKPSRIEKFFTGLGDFVILLAQVIRVNKWKICPLVEVGNGDRTS